MLVILRSFGSVMFLSCWIVGHEWSTLLHKLAESPTYFDFPDTNPHWCCSAMGLRLPSHIWVFESVSFWGSGGESGVNMGDRESWSLGNCDSSWWEAEEVALRTSHGSSFGSSCNKFCSIILYCKVKNY